MPRAATSSAGSASSAHRQSWPNVSKQASEDKADSPTLLWIDDFRPGLDLYKSMLEMHGFRVLTAASGAEGIRLALWNKLDLVITDYEMPGLDGEVVATAIKTLYPGTPVLLFSGSTIVPDRCRHSVDAICDKAQSRNELLAAIHFLLHKKRTRALQPPIAWRASEDRHRTVA